MAFHDSTDWEGPRRVVQEKLDQTGLFRDLQVVDSKSVGWKGELLKKRS